MVRFTHVSLLGLAIGFPAAVRADDGVRYQIETGVASSYVVRGIAQYADRSSPSNQNTAALRLDERPTK